MANTEKAQQSSRKDCKAETSSVPYSVPGIQQNCWQNIQIGWPLSPTNRIRLRNHLQERKQTTWPGTKTKKRRSAESERKWNGRTNGNISAFLSTQCALRSIGLQLLCSCLTTSLSCITLYSPLYVAAVVAITITLTKIRIRDIHWRGSAKDEPDQEGDVREKGRNKTSSLCTARINLK